MLIVQRYFRKRPTIVFSCILVTRKHKISMTLEDVRKYCLAKSGVTEELPFDDVTLVYKVMGKVFAIAGMNAAFINLKCDPEQSLELRAQYEEVTPGYHMNKKHWISVEYTGAIPKREIYQWIDNSYNLIVARLTKAQKAQLATLT